MISFMSLIILMVGIEQAVITYSVDQIAKIDNRVALKQKFEELDSMIVEINKLTMKKDK